MLACSASRGLQQAMRTLSAAEALRIQGSETAVAGMGVGLAICRAIVEAHGGSIRAINPPEGGACVAFTLPRGNPPVIDAEPFANPGERP